MSHKFTVSIVICLIGLVGTATAQISTVQNPNPELIGQLTKKLSITQDQAIGGSGALFGLAKTKMKPEDFLKVSKVVPGMDSLLKAAPQPKQGSDPFGAVTSAVPGKAAGLASLAGSFKQLGLSPNMASQFVPILMEFVKGKGGSDVAGLLAGAWK